MIRARTRQHSASLSIRSFHMNTIWIAFSPMWLVLFITMLSIEAFAQSPPGSHTQIQRTTGLEQVWYGSNLGSVDLLDMFTPGNASWSRARSRIDVWLFSGSQVASGGWSCTVLPHTECGNNHLVNLVNVQAFQQLCDWDIDITIESFFAGPIMTIEPLECSTDAHVLNLTLNGSVNVIQNVQANGGEVSTLRIDEPIRQWYPTHYYLQTGQTDPRPCLESSLETIADHVVAYLQQMQVWFPGLPIGQVELYPEVSVDTLKQWILILEAKGVTLPYLHMDIHMPRVEQYNAWGITIDVGADMRELKSFAEDRGMDFGIIYTDVNWDSQLWDPADYDDQTYYQSTLDWFNFIEAENARPHHLIFQSWVVPYYTTGSGLNRIPINLPEDDPSIYSHTRLVNDALKQCIADLNDDGVVNVSDLLALLGDWSCSGVPGSCQGDTNCDGVTDVNDLLDVLGNWS
ncbi:MAG: hypothetical protein O7G85_08655 [Planctomycetota bacterium]|nr:hypothetical protein [Planctomycetota bacterium]